MEFAYIGDFFRYGEDERGPLFQYRFINLKSRLYFCGTWAYISRSYRRSSSYVSIRE